MYIKINLLNAYTKNVILFKGIISIRTIKLITYSTIFKPRFSIVTTEYERMVLGSYWWQSACVRLRQFYTHKKKYKAMFRILERDDFPQNLHNEGAK